jgi:hypothetical protein
VLATVSDETTAITMADNLFCKNCGEPDEPLSGDLAQRPCPRCGSKARRLNLEARGIAVLTGSASPSVVIGKPTDPYPGASIKQLILVAFSDKPEFRAQGAKAGQIRQFIKDAYARDIDRATLSPQITRLSRDGFIEAAGGGVWKLAKKEPNTDEAPTGDDSDGAPESPDVGE